MGLFKHKHKWTVERTIWPYTKGYGTYCEGCKMVLDIGLSKKDAEESAKALNKRKARN